MSESEETETFKVKDAKGGAFATYRRVVYGDQPLGRMLLGELVMFLLGPLPGAPGLFLRSKLYPWMFASVGGKVVFGRNVTLRHAHKIHLGEDVVVDDNALLDAKGEGNKGLDIGDGVYIGRNSLVYTKNGDITLEDNVNLSSNCQLFSCNELVIGEGTVIGAYSYLLSGGEYEPESDKPFCKQTGMKTKGPTRVGADCWLGARVTVVDGVTVGSRCVVAAGAVVIRDVPDRTTVGGIPARDLKHTG